jgi:hypothetical protein
MNALLIDRYKYQYRTFNMGVAYDNFTRLIKETAKWSAVDMVLNYFHPELGPTPINPKNENHWQSVQILKHNEMLTIYAGRFEDADTDQIGREALDQFVKVLEGVTIRRIPTVLTKDSLTVAETPEASVAPPAVEDEVVVVSESQEPAAQSQPETVAPPPAAEPGGQAPATSSAKKRMTPLYSIPVTNELFHNGNVEAWKKIIQSYTTKYSGCDVFIFYDGERINDINTLFKWGKVKHGSSILISVAGDTISDVATLQRYLRQGASSGFEAFLKFPVNTVLNLF